jgi:hypothetical protein
MALVLTSALETILNLALGELKPALGSWLLALGS